MGSAAPTGTSDSARSSSMDNDLADLARRVGHACRLTGTFTLRSGQVSTTYFDKYLFEADPLLLAAVATAPRARAWSRPASSGRAGAGGSARPVAPGGRAVGSGRSRAAEATRLGRRAPSGSVSGCRRS